MVDKRSRGNYNDNKGNRKRGEKMKLQIISLVISIIVLVWL